jgi:RHS repeat-associated protein
VAQSLGKSFDELYSYDGLQRLKDMQRGTLNAGKTGVTAPTFAQCWSLDPTNNWYGFRESTTGGTWTLNQSRTSNTVNETTNITDIVAPTWITPAYDAAGNTTTLPQPAAASNGYAATYDAWNRLVKLVDTPTGNSVQVNQYDARTFRVERLSYTSGTLTETRHFYYTSQWQSLEERLGVSSTPERQQVWGRLFVDDLVLRDRDTTGNGSLNERLYGLQDANWNIIAVINTSATAQERFLFAPFGWPTFLNGTMSTILATSAIDSSYLYTGQRFDAGPSFYLFRNRFFDSVTGRFITRDPLDYPDGANVYAAWFVPNSLDPSGAKIVPGPLNVFLVACCGICVGTLTGIPAGCAGLCWKLPAAQQNKCFRECLDGYVDAFQQDPKAVFGLAIACGGGCGGQALDAICAAYPIECALIVNKLGQILPDLLK